LVRHGAESSPPPRAWLTQPGLINNVLYVIILSAALDLVGPSVPKGVVLLADVVPSFLTKLCAPYFIHVVPYSARVVFFSLLSAAGMLLVALTPAYTDGGSISAKMAGVVLASLSSGGGELSFLGLTHYYGPFSLAAWGSGTGAAGLVGAGAYSLATTAAGLSVGTTLLASAFLPTIMLASFFAVLPMAPLRLAERSKAPEPGPSSPDDEDYAATTREDEGLLAPGHGASHPEKHSALLTFRNNLRRARGLFFP
jgi:battenin